MQERGALSRVRSRNGLEATPLAQGFFSTRTMFEPVFTSGSA